MIPSHDYSIDIREHWLKYYVSKYGEPDDKLLSSVRLSGRYNGLDDYSDII